MSVNSLLYPNNLAINAQTISVKGISSGDIKVPPIATDSNVLCANLYVERAQYCDTIGNLFPFTITNSPQLDWVLTGLTPTTAEWSDLPSQVPAISLQTDTTVVSIGGADAPTAGQVLTATSGTYAEWQTPSANVTATQAIWSDYANALPTTTTFVNVSNATEPVNGAVLTAVSNVAALWIVPSNPPATLVAVEKRFNGNIYLAGVVTNANTNQTIFINEARFNNTTEEMWINGAYLSEKTTNQLRLGSTPNTTTINSVAPSAPRVVTIPDAGANSSLVTDTGGALNITNTATNNYVLTATGTNTANWAAAAATGITNLNTLTAATQTFATGTTGTDFAVSSATSTHTFNLPDAGASARGVVSTGAQTFAGVKTFSSAPVISSITNTGLLTLPTSTDTLVGRATTDTLTNKTLSGGKQLLATDYTPSGNSETRDILISEGPVFRLQSTFTGIILRMPSAVSQIGATYWIANNSTNSCSLQSNSGVAIATIATDQTVCLVAIQSSTGATAWHRSANYFNLATGFTGTGQTYVMQNTPTLTTPVIGAATGTSLNVTGQLTSTVATGTAPLVISSTTRVSNLNVSNSALADLATTLTTTNSASGAINYPLFAPLNTTSNQGVLVASSFGFIPSTGQIRSQHAYFSDATLQLWMGGNGARITASSGAAVRDITIPNIGANSNIPLSTNLGTVGQVLTNVGSGYGSWQTAAMTAESFTGTTTATAAGTTTLVSTNTTVQVFTGVTTQTVKLPATSGKLGMTFTIINMSTGSVTVQETAAAAVDTLTTITSGVYVCVATDGGANDWKKVASG